MGCKSFIQAHLPKPLKLNDNITKPLSINKKLKWDSTLFQLSHEEEAVKKRWMLQTQRKKTQKLKQQKLHPMKRMRNWRRKRRKRRRKLRRRMQRRSAACAIWVESPLTWTTSSFATFSLSSAIFNEFFSLLKVSLSLEFSDYTFM